MGNAFLARDKKILWDKKYLCRTILILSSIENIFPWLKDDTFHKEINFWAQKLALKAKNAQLLTAFNQKLRKDIRKSFGNVDSDTNMY